MISGLRAEFIGLAEKAKPLVARLKATHVTDEELKEARALELEMRRVHDMKEPALQDWPGYKVLVNLHDLLLDLEGGVEGVGEAGVKF